MAENSNPISYPPGLKHTRDRTNYDVEHPLPIGGPMHFPEDGHHHQYTPNNTYLDNYQEARSNNSSFGVEGEVVLKGSTFETTGLDIENPNAGPEQGGNGGPNRVVDKKIPGGLYTNKKSTDPFNTNITPVLTNEDGNMITNQLHQYTENNKYIDSIPKD